MQSIVLLLLGIATTFDYLASMNWIPHLAVYIYELLTGVVLIYVLTMGVRDRFQFVRSAYWLLFSAIIVVLICGLVLNQVDPGPMFTGLRFYLRALPLFFLPAVCLFSDQQIKTQMRLLLVIAFAQLPLAVHQRMSSRALGGVTGDTTFGTLMDSSYLSIYLIGVACVLTALVLRKRLKFVWFLPLFLIVLFPTAINETKATFLLLPLGLTTIFLLVAPPGRRLRNVLVVSMILATFASIFIPTYDYLIARRQFSASLTDFITQGRIETYLDKEARLGALHQQDVGRIDALVVPLRTLAKDPSHLMFGLGAGNASNSALGPQFVGRYYEQFKFFMQSTVSRVLLEMGLLGVVLVLSLYWMVFNDSRKVAAVDSGMKGTIAIAWAGFTAVMALSAFYKDLILSEAVSCIFWYYSGIIAAQRMRLASRAAEHSHVPLPALETRG